jgi:hypothetical protein
LSQGQPFNFGREELDLITTDRELFQVPKSAYGGWDLGQAVIACRI